MSSIIRTANTLFLRQLTANWSAFGLIRALEKNIVLGTKNPGKYSRTRVAKRGEGEFALFHKTSELGGTPVLRTKHRTNVEVERDDSKSPLPPPQNIRPAETLAFRMARDVYNERGHFSDKRVTRRVTYR